MHWIDETDWRIVVLTFFAAGSVIGVILRIARRGKYESPDS